MNVQREFLISPASSDPEIHWAGQHAAASTSIEAIAPCRASSKGDPHEIIEDCRRGCRRLAGRRHRGGATKDQRSGSGRPDANVVDSAGHLRVPAEYRTLYQALGSWAIAADSGAGSKEMHAVYASPGAIDA